MTYKRLKAAESSVPDPLEDPLIVRLATALGWHIVPGDPEAWLGTRDWQIVAAGKILWQESRDGLRNSILQHAGWAWNNYRRVCSLTSILGKPSHPHHPEVLDWFRRADGSTDPLTAASGRRRPGRRRPWLWTEEEISHLDSSFWDPVGVHRGVGLQHARKQELGLQRALKSAKVATAKRQRL